MAHKTGAFGFEQSGRPESVVNDDQDYQAQKNNIRVNETPSGPDPKVPGLRAMHLHRQSISGQIKPAIGRSYACQPPMA